MSDLPASYLEAHRYDGAAIARDRVESVVPCVVQPRDVALLRDVWRYKFLTAPQLCELWWPGRSERAGQRRLRMLFEAGYLERFRPVTRRGSYPWTYQLAGEGHRLLRRAGVIATHERFCRRSVYDYGHILHELELNAWVLAYRRGVGPALLSWEGETDIEPPAEVRVPQLRLAGDWSAEGLRDPRARLVRPDAVLEVEAGGDDEGLRTVLVEYDRTRRVDKNYEKFRRYDAFLCWWWHHTAFMAAEAAPFVIFVCQDAAHREQFLYAADRELTGHRWHPSAPPDRIEYIGRHRILFASEPEVHAGIAEAWRLPALPPGHPEREAIVDRVLLPGAPAARPQPASSHSCRRRLDRQPVACWPQPLGVLVSRCSPLGVRLMSRTAAGTRNPRIARSRLGFAGRGVHRFALDPPSSTYEVNRRREDEPRRDEDRA